MRRNLSPDRTVLEAVHDPYHPNPQAIMAQDPFPNRIEGNQLRGWILRALLLGVALGAVAGIVALLN